MIHTEQVLLIAVVIMLGSFMALLGIVSDS